MQYTTINTLNGDILFRIFCYYRLDEENASAWNVRLEWYKISHFFRRWVCFLCTNGTPTLVTLAHLPSLPLFLDYRDTTATITQLDRLTVPHALLLCDRVHHIVIHCDHIRRRYWLALSDDNSCPKYMPPHATRHQSAKRLRFLFTTDSPSRTSELLLCPPKVISGTSSARSPDRGTLRRHHAIQSIRLCIITPVPLDQYNRRACRWTMQVWTRSFYPACGKL